MHSRLVILVVVTLTICLSASVAMAGGGVIVPQRAQLDPTLMGFKDSGVWYFLCEAPIFMDRIPPHYATYGPPPPPYCCPPAHPAPPDAKRLRVIGSK